MGSNKYTRSIDEDYYFSQREWDRTVGYGVVPKERNIEMRLREIETEKNMTVSEFWDLLDKHDWTYMMSDDPRQDGPYWKGKQEREKLRRYAELSPQHEELFLSFAKWGQRLIPGQNPDAKKPRRPE